MSLTSAVQIFDVVAPRGARALPNTVPARICVTSNVRNFASFWPRSSGTGEARSYVFQCADLIELQCDTVVPARKAEPLFVAILNRNDEPLVLLPFCIERRQDPSRPVMSVRVLKFLDGGLSDYNTPVVFPVAADWDAKTVRRIWRGLQKALPAFDIAVLEKVPEYVGDLPNPLRPLVNTPEPRSGHAVNLSRKTLAKRLINDKRLQRKLRILGQTGRLTFEIAKTPEQYDTFVEALFRQKNRRDIELRSQESLRGPGYRAYFRKARRYLYPKGPVCLFALKLNDAILATQFAQTFGLRLISQISGFEGGEWSKYSPGHILKREIVQWCLSEGVNILDFGCGDEKWKDDYHADAVPLYKAVIPSSIRGALFLHPPRILKQMHMRRTESWREMGLAESACSNPAEVSSALAHARRSWTLWPSPGRTRELLKVRKHIRATKSGKAS